jgi:hypothetical protein
MIQSGVEGRHIDYEFEYGPPTFDGYLSDLDYHLVYERYRVYFDNQNKAVGVRRHLFIMNDPHLRDDYYHLVE